MRGKKWHEDKLAASTVRDRRSAVGRVGLLPRPQPDNPVTVVPSGCRSWTRVACVVPAANRAPT